MNRFCVDFHIHNRPNRNLSCNDYSSVIASCAATHFDDTKHMADWSSNRTLFYWIDQITTNERHMVKLWTIFRWEQQIFVVFFSGPKSEFVSTFYFLCEVISDVLFCSLENKHTKKSKHVPHRICHFESIEQTCGNRHINTPEMKRTLTHEICVCFLNLHILFFFLLILSRNEQQHIAFCELEIKQQNVQNCWMRYWCEKVELWAETKFLQSQKHTKTHTHQRCTAIFACSNKQ